MDPVVVGRPHCESRGHVLGFIILSSSAQPAFFTIEQADATKFLLQPGCDRPGKCTTLHQSQSRTGRTPARLSKRLTLRLAEMELLNRTIVHAATLDLDQALTLICRDLAIHFAAPQSGIALLNNTGQSLTVIADYTPSTATSAVGAVIPIQDNPTTEYILTERRPLDDRGCGARRTHGAHPRVDGGAACRVNAAATALCPR
jgi:hypothetical protein